jgi:MYXO-CTERM domain-containing protein
MTYRSRARSLGFCLATLAALATLGCTPAEDAAAVTSRARAVTATNPGNLDILFMIDNSSSMTTTQMKLIDQDPSFMTVLQNLTNGLPNVHIAVVSSDMGAPGDSTQDIGCTAVGDDGVFQSTARGACTATTLTTGATFITNVDGVPNYTGTLQSTFGCIAQLGQNGCGFEHQLASVARALGADGAPPPVQNVGFLRDDAELAIVFLTNEDDCSAPTDTKLFSLDVGGSNNQNIANALGPIANYRCNQWGHLCNDPASASPTTFISPPLNPPADAQGTSTAPTLYLTNCESNDTGTGLLTPVATLVAGIRALKADPDNQIVVGAISPPVVPYTVAWVPEEGGVDTQTGELWPQVEHSCGALGSDDVNPLATQNSTDGSFGDPGVRVAQFIHAFGTNGILGSICDVDYGVSFQLIADRIDAHLQMQTSTGAAGSGGNGGSNAGSAGTTGTGAAGASGSGNAGTSGSGNAGAGGHAAAGSGGGATTGGAGTSGTGSAGTSGSGTAGTSGGANGSGSAGASGSGHAGTSGAGTLDAGTISPTGGAGNGPSSGGAGSGGGAGASSVGGGAGRSGAGGATGAAGVSGGGAGTSGTTATGSGSSGCGCDTGASTPSGFGLALLAGALAAVARRRRRAVVTARVSGPSPR